MKLSRNVLILAAAASFVLDFFYLVARYAIAETAPGNDIFHTLLLAIALAAMGILLFRRPLGNAYNPVRLVGTALIIATILLFLVGLIRTVPFVRFTTTDHRLIPQAMTTAIVAGLFGYVTGIAALFLGAVFTELIFLKRRRNTQNNYIALVAIEGLYIIAFTASPRDADASNWTVVLLAVLLTAAIVVNAFRFSWILVLTRREKLLNLGLSFFGFVFFILLAIDSAVFSFEPTTGTLTKALLAYLHPALDAFVSTVFLFAAVAMGIVWVSTLLHLPTAKEFDRKKAEISSFQNMSRLVREVFDLDELLATAAQLAMNIGETEAGWIDIHDPTAAAAAYPVTRAESAFPAKRILRRLSPEQFEALRMSDNTPLHAFAAEAGIPVVVHDLHRDRRLAPVPPDLSAGSLAVIPLRIHAGVVGTIGLLRKNPYDFDKDLLLVVSAFTDLVSVALENSRLIAESLTRERFRQELEVARGMQHSLLPVLLPTRPSYDIYARSLPAYEVGGDYYDVIRFDDDLLGIAIGDVSGKGVSAALYMAEVKGIFHAMSSAGVSTRDLLVRMNRTLCRTMDPKSFISLLFAVLDLRSGRLVFARAGHCPLLYISNDRAEYLRPDGMGLGLDDSERFLTTLEEQELHLRPGDTILLFTDGVTEARNSRGEEFSTGRLAGLAAAHASRPAREIVEAILDAVVRHSGERTADDDMTVLALRWIGESCGSGGSGNGGHPASGLGG
ncbi:MAG: SpoIIE family protein phosphatase [Bacteroidota bacterium]|nr:SpoIIE family protein phosphatase [Bacteroidota bacterium]